MTSSRKAAETGTVRAPRSRSVTSPWVAWNLYVFVAYSVLIQINSYSFDCRS